MYVSKRKRFPLADSNNWSSHCAVIRVRRLTTGPSGNYNIGIFLRLYYMVMLIIRTVGGCTNRTSGSWYRFLHVTHTHDQTAKRHRCLSNDVTEDMIVIVQMYTRSCNIDQGKRKSLNIKRWRSRFRYVTKSRELDNPAVPQQMCLDIFVSQCPSLNERFNVGAPKEVTTIFTFLKKNRRWIRHSI